MSVILNTDSSYIGFAFFVFTEIFLIQIIVTSHYKYLDHKIKKELDDGNMVELNIKEYGPLKTLNGFVHGFGNILIPGLLIIIIACTELGISGTSIETFTKTKTFKSGGYFSFLPIDKDNFERTPFYISSRRQACVDYTENVVTARVSMASLDNDIIICSDEIGVTLTNLDYQCEESFEYEVLKVRDIIYETDYFENTLGAWLNGISIQTGDIKTKTCSGISGGAGKVFWITYNGIYTNAIIDDSWRTGSIGERWVVETSAIASSRNSHNVLGDHEIFDSDRVIVECKEGCFEAIIQWVLTQGNSNMKEDIQSFIDIWYEGLSYDSPIPVCYSKDKDDDGFVEWPIVDYFNTPGCDDAVALRLFPDGGTENVTEISIWAICFMFIVIFASILYYALSLFTTGYNVISYEGISYLHHKEVNPSHTWNGFVTLFRKGDVVTSKLDDADVPKEYECPHRNHEENEMNI